MLCCILGKRKSYHDGMGFLEIHKLFKSCFYFFNGLFFQGERGIMGV